MRRNAAHHALCGGCRLVLPSRAFSEQQLRHDRDEHRRCKMCIGHMMCANCMIIHPKTSFPAAGRSVGLRHCKACLRVDTDARKIDAYPAARDGFSVDRFCSGCSSGSDIYWRWLLNLSQALKMMPQDVLKKVLNCLEFGAGAAAIGRVIACGQFYFAAVVWPTGGSFA